MNITFSGAVFTSLISSLSQRENIQEGFLLGSLSKITSNLISDSQICNEDVKTTVNVFAFVPCSSLATFYDGAGMVKHHSLKNLLGEKFEHAVGWYRHRGTCESLHLKETRIHQQLNDIFKHKMNGLFIVGLFSGNHKGKEGTMGMKFKFGVMRENQLEGISTEIANLKDTSTSHYQLDKSHTLLYSADNSSAIEILSYKDKTDAEEDTSVMQVRKLHDGICKEIGRMLPKLAQISIKHNKFITEVNRLRALCYMSGITPDFHTHQQSLTPSLQVDQEDSQDRTTETNDKQEDTNKLNKLKCQQIKQGHSKDTETNVKQEDTNKLNKLKSQQVKQGHRPPSQDSETNDKQEDTNKLKKLISQQVKQGHSQDTETYAKQEDTNNLNKLKYQQVKQGHTGSKDTETNAKQEDTNKLNKLRYQQSKQGHSQDTNSPNYTVKAEERSEMTKQNSITVDVNKVTRSRYASPSSRKAISKSQPVSRDSSSNMERRNDKTVPKANESPIKGTLRHTSTRNAKSRLGTQRSDSPSKSPSRSTPSRPIAVSSTRLKTRSRAINRLNSQETTQLTPIEVPVSDESLPEFS